MKKSKLIAGRLVIISILSGILCSRSSTEVKKQEKTTPVLHVKVGKVIRDSIALPLSYPGRLSTATELRLGFKTGGIIRNISVDEGTLVRKGTLLATLDTIEIFAYFNKAKTAFEKAVRDLSRTRQLYKDSAATFEQMQNAESAFKAAKADVDIARYNRRNTVLTAPATGRILKRLAEKNEVISSGKTILILALTGKAWQIKASVPDVDLPLLSIGDSAQIRFDALPRKVFSGHLKKISTSAHPVTGTFEIEIDIDRSDSGLRYGLFADIKLYPARQRSLYFIPATALARANGMSGIVIAVGNDNTPLPVHVSIERMFGDWIAVSEGLSNTKEIVTSGAAYILSTNDKIVFDR
jgi:RND family efflux transporter MFP subunit